MARRVPVLAPKPEHRRPSLPAAERREQRDAGPRRSGDRQRREQRTAEDDQQTREIAENGNIIDRRHLRCTHKPGPAGVLPPTREPPGAVPCAGP